MKLFAKNKFVWTEPWFFCQRIRDKSDWLRAVLLAVVVAVTLIVAMFAFGRQQNLPWWQIVGIGVVAGLIVQLGVEAAFLNREVTIDEDSIHAFGQAGQITSSQNFPLNQITAVQIRRSSEIGYNFSILLVQMGTKQGGVGIPNSIRLERLAQTLHELKIPVTLSGWAPAVDPDWDQNPYVYIAPETPAPQPAKVSAIPEAAQNLTPVPAMLLALLMAGWVFLVWLGLMVVAGILIYQYWALLGIWGAICCCIAMFASLTIPFGYVEIWGNHFAASHLIQVGRNKVRERSDSLIKSFDVQHFSVELIERETWAALAPKVIDFGFLLVEKDRQQILYEGNKERWTLPLSSIRICKVEEVQFGTAGETATGQLRCFVVLVFQKETGPYEIGLRVADSEFGKVTDTRRMRQATELFEFLVGELKGISGTR